MCVSVPINYYMLADFRVAHKAALDDLLSQIIATLMSKELVKLTCVSQDGMRIRASAGSGSYRRRGGLKRCLAEARKQVKRLAKERESQTPCARSVSAQLRRGRPESGKSVSRKRWGRCLRWRQPRRGRIAIWRSIVEGRYQRHETPLQTRRFV